MISSGLAMPTSHLSESLSEPANRAVEGRPTPIRKMIHFELGDQDATVMGTGGTRADVEAALAWFDKHARRLAKKPPPESGGQLIRKLRQGTVKT